MRITQGTFSFLPDFTDDEVKLQLEYALQSGWALAVEFTDDPHPRNSYWDMWDLPMFDIEDASGAFIEVKKCREAYPNHYIKVSGYDARYTKQTIGLVHRQRPPDSEPGFRLDRTEANDRHLNYTMHSYAQRRPTGRVTRATVRARAD